MDLRYILEAIGFIDMIELSGVDVWVKDDSSILTNRIVM